MNNNRHATEWKLHIDDNAFPDFLLIRATGDLDDSFYLSLFADLKAYMAATVGLRARFVPLVVDARQSYPDRNGLNRLHQLVRRPDCPIGHVILWISQRGPNSPFQNAVALMLRALLSNVDIITHLDEAYGVLGLPIPARSSLVPDLRARFARWSL